MHLDRHYTDPRLAAIYDVENAGRHDTDLYLGLAAELGARRVADLGCGTGVLACELAAQGHQVTGLDPAPAMLDIARSRPGAEEVTWIEGTADDLAQASFDLLVMSGHVAQVFIDDQGWLGVLHQVHRALRPNGWLVFESRNPAVEPWRAWNRADSFASFPAQAGVEAFGSWVETLTTGDGIVTVLGHTVFEPSGDEELVESTLRFRPRNELENDLTTTGFQVRTLYGGWDRAPFDDTNTEMIFVAERR
jgi:ubiquinone/menaquinone biosynthesis C-methylase UbiE